MLKRTTIALTYDGTLEGFFSCIYVCFYQKYDPVRITTEQIQEMLYPTMYVKTNQTHAKRVAESIPKKIGEEAQSLILQVFLSNKPEKELYLLEFLRKGYRTGPKIIHLLTDETVDWVTKTAEKVGKESHFFREFLRFSIYEKRMLAVINPKNRVLPLIQAHFCDRYSGECFVIFDQTHKEALFYRPFEWKIIPVEKIDVPTADEAENKYRALWRLFHKTIVNEKRKNLNLQRNLLPHRYRLHMTEFLAEEQQKHSPYFFQQKQSKRELP